MSTLQTAISSLPNKNGKIKAAKTFTIRPDHFSDTWSNRPVDEIILGLRVPSEADVQGAKLEAYKQAAKAQIEDDDPNEQQVRLDVFNSTILALVVSSSICDPHDVTSPHPFFELADEMVPLALKPNTIKSIWDSVERLHVEQSPVFPEITPTEEVRLMDILTDEDPYKNIDPIKSSKAKRFLRFALELLEEE